MTYVLVPGAGGAAWYWSRVVPLLESAGHDAIAVDLPGDDESAGPREYADIVVAATSGADDVVLVAQSMGGFTAPLICQRIAVRELVLVNAMIPVRARPRASGGVTSTRPQPNARRPRWEATASSIWRHTSCMTSRRMSRTEANRTSEPRPISASIKHVIPGLAAYPDPRAGRRR